MHTYTTLSKNLTTFHLGDQEFTVTECTIEELKELYTDNFFKQSWKVLGGGSNTVFVTGKEFQILKISSEAVTFKVKNERVLVECEAGKNWHDLVTETVDLGYWGLENMALIPGTVGATPIQNIGAYGVELKDVLESVTYFDTRDGSTKVLPRSQCRFGYRDSIFKQELKDKVIITSLILKLSTTPKPILTYKDMKVLSGDSSQMLIYNTVCKIRNSKLPDWKVDPNCGSFFQNPILYLTEKDELLKRHPKAPIFEVEDHYKTSAAWLIDHSKLKGTTIQGVLVSDKQPLVLINSFAETVDNLNTAVDSIQKTVLKKTGVRLLIEVNLI